MAKAKKTKKQKAIIKKLNGNPWILVGIVILLLLGIWYTYGLIAKYNEKQQFKQAENSIQNVADAISSKIEKPQDADKRNHCSYVSRKEGNGPRSCNVAIILSYTQTPNDQADLIMSKIDAMNELNGSLFTKEKSKPLVSFEKLNEARAESNTTSYKANTLRLGCYITYSRNQPFRTKFDKPFATPNPTDFYVEISCGGPARAEYYPVD